MLPFRAKGFKTPQHAGSWSTRPRYYRRRVASPTAHGQPEKRTEKSKDAAFGRRWVERLTGIEPATFCLGSRCATDCATAAYCARSQPHRARASSFRAGKPPGSPRFCSSRLRYYVREVGCQPWLTVNHSNHEPKKTFGRRPYSVCTKPIYSTVMFFYMGFFKVLSAASVCHRTRRHLSEGIGTAMTGDGSVNRLQEEGCCRPVQR